jgi:hypothetical protein
MLASSWPVHTAQRQSQSIVLRGMAALQLDQDAPLTG